MTQLFSVCQSERKIWRTLPNGGHNDSVAEPGYFDHIHSFITEEVMNDEKWSPYLLLMIIPIGPSLNRSFIKPTRLTHLNDTRPGNWMTRQVFRFTCSAGRPLDFSPLNMSFSIAEILDLNRCSFQDYPLVRIFWCHLHGVCISHFLLFSCCLIPRRGLCYVFYASSLTSVFDWLLWSVLDRYIPLFGLLCCRYQSSRMNNTFF